MKRAAHTIEVEDLIEFAPNPRYPTRRVRGRVLRWRKDPRGGAIGWLDVACEDGLERSVRPNRAARV